MVNENIDIAMILSTNAGKRLAEAYKLHQEMISSQLSPQTYFELRSQEREACIETVILFQASLEAMINEEISSEKKLQSIKKENEELNKKFKALSFKNKWQKSFEVLKTSAREKKYLANYLQFYISFRVPITHAKSRYINAELFNYLNVYDGLKNGYLSVEVFYKKLEKFSSEHTWKKFSKMCSLPE